MATKKHNLTVYKDTITGKAVSDLFLGTKGELGSNDMLDGAGGVDTIFAMVRGINLSPVMKNIEKGVFTHQGKTKLGLDLSDADQMTSVTLKDLHAAAVVRHAAAATSFNLSNVENFSVSLTGVVVNQATTQHLFFNKIEQVHFNYQTEGNGSLVNLDVSLNECRMWLQGDTSVSDLTIHSQGTVRNIFVYETDTVLQSIDSVKIDGAAGLSFGTTDTEAFNIMRELDASKSTGGLSMKLVSSKLELALGGAGRDDFDFRGIGGTQVNKAEVNMGAAADSIKIDHLVFDGSRMVLDGGGGRDRLIYDGADHGLAAGVKNIEVLSLADAEGTYALNSQFKELDIQTGSETADQVKFAGGSGLVKVRGSLNADTIEIADLGGSAGNKAQVYLRSGDDMVRTNNLTLDASKQHFDGGAGYDGFVATGHIDNIGTLFTHFEYAYLFQMSGTYDFAGSGVHTVIFGSAPATAMTINGLGSGAQISLLTSQTTITTVNLVNADTRTDEILLVDLGGSADFGNNTLGLIAPHLSELQISSRDNAHTMYISEVGDASDFATLSLFGGKHLTLIASNGSTSFIDKIVSTNTAGIDMLGMLEGTKALASSGVGILGGSGSDVLVGGTGADTIIGGAGDDTIYGSLGVDAVDLSGGGVDMLIFRSQAESAYNSGDNIVGFSIFSGIDISDLVSSVNFGGNVASNSEGLSKLSTNHSVGFFNTTNHMLYVDIDHDGSLTSVDDMAFQLNGLNSFNGSSLIG